MRVGWRIALVVAVGLVAFVVRPDAGHIGATLMPGETRCFWPGGRDGDVALLNLTPLNAAAAGYGYVTRDTLHPLTASNVNFEPGTVDPNFAVVQVRASSYPTPTPGLACFVNSPHAEVDIVVDSLGVLSGAGFVPPASNGPTRVLDTRIGFGGSRLARGGRVCFPVTGSNGDAAIVNLTPVEAAGAGFGLLISSDVAVPPVASNVNFAPGSIQPSVGIAPIGADGRVCFINSQHTTVDLVADHLGSIKHESYVPASSSGAPRRALDTRGETRVEPSGRRCFAVTGVAGDAAIVNLTPVLATGPGYGLLVSSDVIDRPLASNVNFTRGSISPNIAIAPIGADGKVCFLNSNHSTIDLVADHLGTIRQGAFEFGPLPPRRLLDTRPLGEVTLTSTGGMTLETMDCSPEGGLCMAAGQSVDGHVAVFRSQDLGRSWTPASILPDSGQVARIDCPSDTTCFMVGGDGTAAFVLKSEDEGLTFSRRPPEPAGAPLRDISCADVDTCVVVGSVDPPSLLRTEDGGSTWTSLAHGFPTIRDIECPELQTCYVSAETAGMPTLARSSDGGSSWVETTPPLDLDYNPNIHIFRYLHCFDSQRCSIFYASALDAGFPFGVINTRNHVDETFDGGVTWVRTNSPGLGLSDCADLSWCIQLSGELSIYSFSPGINQFYPQDVASVPHTVPTTPPTNVFASTAFLGCPVTFYCFLVNHLPTQDFITRIPRMTSPTGG